MNLARFAAVLWISCQPMALAQSTSPTLGQGLLGSELASAFCRAGRVNDLPAPQTIDKMTRPDDRDAFGGCNEPICTESAEGGKRPFLVTKKFTLEHRVGKRILSDEGWAFVQLGALRRSKPDLFAQLCGDRFASIVELGGLLEVKVVAAFTSVKERDIFLQETQFDVATMRTLRSHLERLSSVDGELLVSLRQTGGDPSGLSRVLAQRGRYLLCRLADASGCLATLDSVLRYSLEYWLQSLKSAWHEKNWPSLATLRFDTGAYPD